MSEAADTSLLNGKQLAAKLGVSAGQVTLWHQANVIPAEIKEGRCIRFDLERVREHLAKRAAKKGARR
jgi:predicted DNA-binding transcriptional regulator AlpA